MNFQAFNTGNADLVKMILTHKSAEEDMLLSQSSLGKGGSKQKPKEPLPEDTPGDLGASNGVPADGSQVEDDRGEDRDEGGEGEKGGEGPSITHELGFRLGESENAEEEGPTFRLRELWIKNPERCFGEDARKDTTGLCLWASAVVLARWVASPDLRARLEGQKVLELGAGCGAG